MTKAEVLKKSAGIVAALIKLRTPPISELTEAYKSLGAVVELTKALTPGDAVPTEVATGVAAVIERMESFRSGYCSNDVTQKTVNKSFTLAEFTTHLKAEVDAANADTNTARALKRLHTLADQIAKASAQGSAVPTLEKSTSVEETTTITLPVYVDPAQIVPTDTTSSAAAAQSGAPAGDSGVTSGGGGGGASAVAGNAVGASIVAQGTGTPSAGNYEASKSAGAPVAKPGDALAAAAAVVETATIAKGQEQFDGWPLDLNAPPRKSKVHFGKDPLRPRA